MTVVWVLNALGLFSITVAALLLFLYLQAAPRFAQELQTTEAKREFARHQRSLAIAIGLLALWLILQYVAVVLL